MKTTTQISNLRGGLCLFLILLSSSISQAQTTIFFEGFESGGLSGGTWVANPGPVNGLAGVVAASSCGGAHHLRLGKTADAGGYNTASADLTLNLSAYVDSQLTLRFCTYDYVDEEQFQDGLFASNDGGTNFVKLVPFQPLLWTNFTWGARVAYDLDQLLKAAFGSVPNTVILRFQQYGTGDFNQSNDEDGIGIDNITVATERPVVPAPVPYTQSFAQGSFPPEWRPASREANDSLGTALLNRYPYLAIAGSGNNLHLGKSADAEGGNLNAVDLYLLLGTYVDSQLLFNFSTYDYVDEYQALYDGVFASINQGASFQKIIDFAPNAWTNFTFGRRVPYDLDQLLKEAFGTPTLPDTLILRFQQYGTGDFNQSYDEDGILIDDIEITVERVKGYANLPYSQDFAGGTFTPEWWPSSRVANDSLGINALNRFPYLAIAGTGNNLHLGKSSDAEGGNLNAVDLNLILGTYVDSQLLFNFSTYDYVDEYQALYDGVYASIDQGATFQKIIDFAPDTWTNFTFGRRVDYDLDQLIRDACNTTTLPDTLILRFQQYGTGDFNQSYDEDGILLDDISIRTDPAPVYATLPYLESFASGSLPPEWRNASRVANDSLGTNLLGRFPRLRIEGTGNNLWMGKTSDAEGGNLNAADLYLNLGTYADSQLLFAFSIYDYQEDYQANFDGVYASINQGADFLKIIDFNPNAWTDFTFGRRVPYDLDKLIKTTFGVSSLPDTLILRFQQYGTGDFNQSYDEDGLLIDDILIEVARPQVYAPIPYFQSFESGTFTPEWIHSSEQAVGQTTLSASINQLNRFWRAQVYNLTNAVTGTYAMRMGKTSDVEGVNLNALDLHVNLQGESQVELKYYVFKFYDEKQVDDGIWMSVDGGQNFVKIYDYNLDNISNNVWVQQTVDLSAMAVANGLVLSDSTIIRFQQSGTGDFSTSGDEDGLSFDNIEINCLAQVADFGFDVDCSTLEVTFSDSTQGTNITTPFAWDFDGDGVVDTVANGNISHVYSGTGTFSVTLYVGDPNGCGDSITRQVFIGSSVPAPTINPAGPTVDLCAGATLLFSAQVGYQGYLWSNGSNGQTLQVSAPGTYSVRGLGIDGCYSSPTVINVVERPAPLKPFLSLAGEPVFCQGDSVELIAPFGASAYDWNTGATGQSIVVTNSGQYSVRIANSFGCFSPPADTTITVLPTPGQPAITLGASGIWLSSSTSGQFYRWFLDGVQIAADSQSIDASLFGPGTYTVQVANGECASDLSAPFAFSSTGLETMWEGSLQVYPNPSAGRFVVAGTQSNSLRLQIRVFNAWGQLVLPEVEREVSARWNHELDLSGLAEGLYHLEIQAGQQVIRQKLVLQR